MKQVKCMAKWKMIPIDGKEIEIDDEKILPDEETQLPNEIQFRGILKALHRILECPEGESILTHAYWLTRKSRIVSSKEAVQFIAEHRLSLRWEPSYLAISSSEGTWTTTKSAGLT